MPKKRKSRGRSKGTKGRTELVECDNCGALVPRDKIKRVTVRVSPVDAQLAKELKAKGAYISSYTTVKNYCVSCAVHYGIVKVRSREERKLIRPLGR